MSELPADHPARTRFREEFWTNFAVSANAGSGKTTAISQRLAHLALTPEGAELLPRLVVVTFTKKAAAQMRERARTELLAALVRRQAAGGEVPTPALERLDHAFFGTIHSFCLQLGQQFGASYGLNLNPTVLEDDGDDELWEEFLEQDRMQFASLPEAGVRLFLRFVPLEEVFPMARELSLAAAQRLLDRAPAGGAEPPAEHVLAQLLALEGRGPGRKNLEATQRAAAEWVRRFRTDSEFLPMLRPVGAASRVKELVQELTAPLKMWLAAAAGALAAELALRYREYRMERGVQTYADQVEAALAILQHRETLDQIRAEGFRVLLDEAQDTDPRQFAVLVEITRPPGAAIGDWPEGGGPPPRPGHFCMVGDAQQAIYGSRADVRRFLAYRQAFARGDGGVELEFSVTFRAPRRIAAFCNQGFAAAFGKGPAHNVGGSPRRLLQVPYSPLVAAPGNRDGDVSRLALTPPEVEGAVAPQLAEEVRQIARFLKAGGPGAVGATSWGEICLLAPRNDWLVTARKALEGEGLKVALQMRRNRNAEHPVYAWLSGLLAVACDPENAFEWIGVLREVFAIADDLLARIISSEGAFCWENPERHPEPVAGALRVLAPLIAKVDEEGAVLEDFVDALVAAGGLRDKARVIDPSGGHEAELERLRFQAVQVGQSGGGPREWLRELLAHRDEGRPAGKPAEDAVNLLTSHSAKGLEWPVVMPFGLWRPLRDQTEKGLRLLGPEEPEAQVYFDGESVPVATREARSCERLRELTRLLYVTFTRARSHLVLPWHPRFASKLGGSFADLWGDPDAFSRLPETGGHAFTSGESRIVTGPGESQDLAGPATAGDYRRPAAPPLPQRLLPHELAGRTDAVRTNRHDSLLDETMPGLTGDDPIDYGLWWHETMEYLPWDRTARELDEYFAGALARARSAGFGTRADDEIAKLRGGPFFTELRNSRGQRLAELSVFAPLRPDAWIDGVIDLVIFDESANLVRVIDWKTNRARPSEAAETLLERLCLDYRPQLAAYGSCMALFFPGSAVRLEIYSSAVGAARAWTPT